LTPCGEPVKKAAMIKLTELHLQLGSKELLSNANLTVYPGQIWGVLGAIGAGKSSLFKLL
jgi:ATP-binding cassette subfamily F protein 3